MDKGVEVNFKQFSIIFWLVPVVIAVNFSQLLSIRDVAGRQWGALHRLADKDIFSQAVLAGRINQYSPFLALRSFSPNSVVISNEYKSLRPGEGFRAKLITIGHVRGFKSIGTKLNISSLFFSESQGVKAIRGEYYESGEHQRSGRPPIKWKIYLPSSKPSKQIFFIYSKDENTLLFVDLALLPDLLNTREL